MKIYTVTRGSYSEYEVLANFLDKEKAEDFALHHCAFVEEFPFEPEFFKHSEGYLPYRVCDGINGVMRCRRLEVDDFKDREKFADGCFTKYFYARDEEHALKIFSERRRLYVARGIEVIDKYGDKNLVLPEDLDEKTL